MVRKSLHHFFRIDKSRASRFDPEATSRGTLFDGVLSVIRAGTPTNQKERLKLKHFTEASTQVFLSLAGFHPAP